MRIARITDAQGIHAVRQGEGELWIPIEDPYEAFLRGETPRDIGDPRRGTLLAPCVPTVIVGIAQNGPQHSSPVQAWLKSPRTVSANNTVIHLRRDAGTTVAEAEVAVVIGRDTDGLSAVTAHEYVLGITAVNDLSSPDRAEEDPRNFESKSGVGYTPLGPWIDTSFSIDDDMAMSLLIDGEVHAATSSALLPITIRECLEYVTRWAPLGPGDVIMTGAPFSAAPVSAGSRIDVVIGDIRLGNPTQ